MLIIVLLCLLNVCTSGGGTPFCYQPWVPENGHVIFAEPGPYSEGTVARYSCALGFERVGNEERTCQSNGKWSGSAPLCAIDVSKNRPCEQSSGSSPTGPTKGKCSISDNDKGSWWAVDLLGEYEIHAIGIRVGSTSSPIESIEMVMTSGEKHSCDLSSHTFHTNQTVHVKCRAEKVARVVVTAKTRLHLCNFNAFATNTVSAWQCAVGSMEMVGVLDGMCYSASKDEKTDWKGAQGKCLDRGASLPMRISSPARRGLTTALSNLKSDSAFYWIGLFSADSEWRWADGEALLKGDADWPENTNPPQAGQTEAIILARPLNWKWIPAAQTAWNPYICQSKPKFCTSPGVGEAGRVAFSSHSYAIGTECFYSCEDGFKLHGDQTRECLEGGRWSGHIPKCLRVDCGDPRDWNFGSVHLLNGTTQFESVVEYVCSAGYETLGNRFRICRSDGSWDGQPPDCEPLDCGRPPSIANGKFKVSNTTVNGSAVYQCNDEYRLIGHDTVFCSEKSLWEPNSPVCYDLATLREMKGNGAGEGNAFLALLAVILVTVLVAAVIKVSRPNPSPPPAAPPSENKYSASPVSQPNHVQVIYATPTALPGSAQNQRNSENVIYYATSQPLTHVEVPPQLLQLQQLPNGNIGVTLPFGRPTIRPSMPTFPPEPAPPSPTPSQLLYSFDHEPYYDMPPVDGTLCRSNREEDNIYERLPDPKSPQEKGNP